MKRNVLNNIQLDSNEKVYKAFRKINAKGYSCQILLTTKRLIIYSRGFLRGGRRTKQKRMNEIDLNSIHKLEYYIEYTKNNPWVRLIGFVLFLAALAAGYFLYMGRIPVPASIPFQPASKYAAVGFLVFITLIMMFRVDKTLFVLINTGLNDRTTLKLDVNKYNELAIRYLASKIRPN